MKKKKTRRQQSPEGSLAGEARTLHETEQIAAAKFKAHCLELLDHVQQGRRTIIVTKHGKPVARLVPYEDDSPPILGFLKNTVIYQGDVVSPIDEAWDADVS